VLCRLDVVKNTGSECDIKGPDLNGSLSRVQKHVARQFSSAPDRHIKIPPRHIGADQMAR